MLANTLVTSEIKNSAGTEQEFQRLSSQSRQTTFGLITEVPSRPHRLTIAHSETGVGFKLRRRSVVRFDKTVISDIDTVTPVTISAYQVMDIPVGALGATTEIAHVNANLLSFMASLGANTTILYDGTGNGSVCMITGGL